MGTIKEYFDFDFDNTFKISTYKKFIIDGNEYKLDFKLIIDFNASISYLSFYIPYENLSFNFFKNLLNSLIKDWETKLLLSEKFFIELPSLKYFPGKVKIANQDNSFELIATFFGESPINYKSLAFSGRIFFYSETQLEENNLKILKQIANQHNIKLQLRSKIFAIENSALIKPFAFICHDSRDKESIAKPLAISLSQHNCPVWYDEFALEIGNNLRENIEKGIKECKRCIIILTPNFLSNKGWTKTEFESIFSRQIFEKKLLVLPIWNNINSGQVYEYSPSLLNVYALEWSKFSLEEISNRIMRVIFADVEAENRSSKQNNTTTMKL